MKTICILFAIIFMTSCFGEVSPTYTMLTNELSQCIANSTWRYETNGAKCVRKIMLPVAVNKQFSDEIIAALKRCCPKEWNDVVLSSGNTDNPKMLPLRPYFNSAVLQTPTIITFQSFVKNMINQDVVLRVHHEKLSYTSINIDKPDKKKRIIRCFLCVEIRDVINADCKDGIKRIVVGDVVTSQDRGGEFGGNFD